MDPLCRIPSTGQGRPVEEVTLRTLRDAPRGFTSLGRRFLLFFFGGGGGGLGVSWARVSGLGPRFFFLWISGLGGA